MILTDSDFSKISLLYYDNPSCVDIREFQDDLRRFNVLNRRLSTTEIWTPDTYRKILNSLVILYNLFGEATNEMLRYKILPEHLGVISAMAEFLSKRTDQLAEINQLDYEFLEKLNVINQ